MFVSSNSFDSLKKHFIDELGALFSERELRSILLQVVRKRLNNPNLDQISVRDAKFSESDLLYFRSIRKRLLANEPIQYVLGEVSFYGLELISDSRALIPRPETEELVDWIVSEWKGEGEIMDVCAGSGCIALALKSVFKENEIIALELSDEALSLIEENARKTDLDLSIRKGDALSVEMWDQIHSESLSLIVSNPPYVLESDKAQMQQNVLDFEPHMALFVEDHDPLLFYREIATNGLRVLNKNGWIYFEIHEALGQEMIQLLQEIGFVNIELRKDLQGKDRMIRGKK